jgi:hypothetical protein
VRKVWKFGSWEVGKFGSWEVWKLGSLEVGKRSILTGKKYHDPLQRTAGIGSENG